MNQRLLGKLFRTYILFFFFTATPLLTFGLLSFRSYYYREEFSSLKNMVSVITQTVTEKIEQKRSYELLSFFKGIYQNSQHFVTLLSPGKIISSAPYHIDFINFMNDDQRVALQKKSSTSSILYSEYFKSYTLVEIRKIYIQGELYGYLKVEIPRDDFFALFYQFLRLVIFIFTLSLIIVTALSFTISRLVLKPIKTIINEAEYLLQGNHVRTIVLSHKAPDEFKKLAMIFNNLSVYLEQRIRTISQHRKRQEAILKSMNEGLIGVDINLTILHVNRSAAQMLSLNAQEMIGRKLDTTIASPDIVNFLLSSLSEKSANEMQLSKDDEVVSIKANTSPLMNEHEQKLGHIILLTDVTRLKKLESLRKDFVSNVSHELRTPLTSISGYIETLQEIALEIKDEYQQKEISTFLDVIKRQSQRLYNMVSDLLSLSRIENKQQFDDIEFERLEINEIIQNAISLCLIKAQEKNINIIFTPQNNLILNLNEALIEQALINLIDNAIKYSYQHTNIVIDMRMDATFAYLTIQDEGQGISQENLERLFERFFRVDRSRNSKITGTGLGLSIVKHIMMAHKGEIDVESSTGSGSTFTLKFKLLES